MINPYLEPMSKKSSLRKRSKRAAGGEIAVPGTSVNGLVRANRKRRRVGETGAARYSGSRMSVREQRVLSQK